MKRIGFVVESISSLKVLGEFLRQAKNLDVQAVTFIPSYRKGKFYDGVTQEMLMQHFNLSVGNIFDFLSAGLVESVQKARVESVVLLNPYRNFAKEVVALAGAGVQVYGLDYFANSAYVAASKDDLRLIQASLDALAGRFVTSDWWRDFEFAIAPEHKRWQEKFLCLGTPLIDAFRGIDEAVARGKLNLDLKKPVVTVFTPNIRDHQAYFFYGLGTGFALRRLANLLREYCDARDYQLVVKSREKQWDAAAFIDVADVFVQDLPDAIHPSTSALLLSASSLAIHFGSMMVMEAAATKVPSIAIAPEKIDKLHGYMREEPRKIAANAVLKPRRESLFNFGDVSTSFSAWPNREKFFKKADEMISRREESGQYDLFNAKFSGWQVGSTVVERIIEALQ